MVCIYCRIRPVAQHEKCKGGQWCDCQHRGSSVQINGPTHITSSMQNTEPQGAAQFGELSNNLLLQNDEKDNDTTSAAD